MLVVFICLSLLAGCTVTNNNFDISTSEDIAYVDINGSLNLMSELNDTDIYWTSTDTDILVINSSNNIATAIDDGIAYLIAKDYHTDEVLKKIAVVVAKEKATIKILGSQNIVVGYSYKYEALVSDESDNEVFWTSSDESIATIDEDGNLKAISAGIIKVKATSKIDSELKAEIDVLIQKEIAGNLTNEETTVTEEINLDSLTTIFKPIIEKGLSSMITISSYIRSYLGTERLMATGAGVIYKRNVILNSGIEVQDSDNIKTEDISSYKYYVITNRHIISNATNYNIYYGENEEIQANLIQYDDKIDLAVLYFTTKLYFATATFSDSEEIKQGEFCISLGTPFNKEYYQTATLGIVSYTNRYVSTDTDGDDISDWDSKYIQHDAAVSEGNSGGPLINLKGEVIGINTTKIIASDVDNMGFAIPSNLVLTIVEMLEQGIRPIRPVLNITVTGVKDILSGLVANHSSSDIPTGITHGLYIEEVTSGGLGDKAGLMPKDIILEFNGVTIYESHQLRDELSNIIIGANQEIEIKICRDNQVITLILIS